MSGSSSRIMRAASRPSVVWWGHPDVDDREVGSVLANERDQLGGVAALAHHLEAGTLEQAGQTLAQKDVVLGQHHSRTRSPSHRRLWSTVGRPG